MEFKIEGDINKIEESLKSIVIKQGIYEVGDIYPFYIIKDIELIINNLNTQYSIWFILFNILLYINKKKKIAEICSPTANTQKNSWFV